tara:strand:+ start:937 stop:1182 length:246 start_codon:yes stop_codon:yes gene_type:complete
MKKILIAVGALGVMSFTTNQLINTWQLSQAINDVQDLQEWMQEDINNGRLDESIGSDYLQTLQEAEYRMIEYIEANRIVTN